MTRRVVGGVLLVALGAFGCQSAEERQAQELRQALRQIVDEIEELRREEIELLRQRKEVVDATPSFKTQWGYETMDRARATAKSVLEAAELRLPETVAELRREVEEYTDAELPMFSRTVRGRKTGAERSVEKAKKGLTTAQQEKKAAEQRAAKEAAPEEFRAELSARIDEVDQIYGRIISVLQELQDTETGQYMKTRAGEAVRTAEMRRANTNRLLRRILASAKDTNLSKVEGTIGLRRGTAETELDRAQRKLAARK